MPTVRNSQYPASSTSPRIDLIIDDLVQSVGRRMFTPPKPVVPAHPVEPPPVAPGHVETVPGGTPETAPGGTHDTPEGVTPGTTHGEPQPGPVKDGEAPPRLGVDAPVVKPDPKFGPGAGTKASLGSEAELQAMGLKPGTPERAAFDKFIEYFDKNAAHKTDQPWVFYTKTGENTKQTVQGFRDAYASGKYRLEGEPQGGTLHNFIDDFDIATQAEKTGPGPAPNEDLWYDGVLSFASARIASTRGGPVRILIPKGENLMPRHKSWSDFEAYELTRPESKMTELWRYDSNNPDAPPELAWKKGDPPLGQPVDFSQKMIWEAKRF